MDTNEQDDDREVTEQSRSFEVARTDEGWGVWDRRQLPGGPLAMYPPGDRGFESAYEHFTRLNRGERRNRMQVWSMKASLWVAIVSGLLWIVSTAAFQIRINLIEGGFQSEAAFEALRWTDVVSGIGYPIFFVTFGIYVMLWMKRRNDVDRSPVGAPTGSDDAVSP